MAGRQAKILNADQIVDLLAFADASRRPLRNRVLVLLSVKAGCRAAEIANLTWDMVLAADGNVGSVLEVRDAIAKKRRGRRLPIHPELAQALADLRIDSTAVGPVIQSERGGPMTPLSVVIWFRRAFQQIGVRDCSSHSGRRTFITNAARLVHKAGGSLRDVQLLAGHRSLLTTQAYIDGDTDAQRKLVGLL